MPTRKRIVMQTDDSGGQPSSEGRTRFRCAACGNLTRFDVYETRRTRSFHHFSLGGDLSVEEEEVLATERERVRCRWCGSSDAIEELAVDEDPTVEAAHRSGEPPEER